MARQRSAKQQARIDSYLRRHPGATIQEARGHKPKEHIRRRERETAIGGLTSQQRSRIRKAVREEGAKRGRSDAETAATAAAAVAWATRQGFERWTEFRRTIRGRQQGYQSMAYAQWQADHAQPSWIQDVGDEFDLPAEMEWLAQYK